MWVWWSRLWRRAVVNMTKDEGWVSPHFRRHEFSCPCCDRYIRNQSLLSALEKLRHMANHAPITVTSGVRCMGWNEAKGGASKSKHLLGSAADVVVKGLHPEEVAVLAEGIEPFNHGGIGIYPAEGFVHLDVRADGPARWEG